jgi:hypothetical protein
MSTQRTKAQIYRRSFKNFQTKFAFFNSHFIFKCSIKQEEEEEEEEEEKHASSFFKNKPQEAQK